MNGDLKNKKLYESYSPFSRNVYPCLFFLCNKNYVACTLSCRIKGITYQFKLKMQIREMEGEEEAFSHEREAKCLNISVGNVETKSNGHRSIVEPKTLI